MDVVKSEEAFLLQLMCLTDGIKPKLHSQAVIDKQLQWPQAQPPLYNNKWVHFKWERTLPVHAVWIPCLSIPYCPSVLSACQGSGAGADAMRVWYLVRDVCSLSSRRPTERAVARNGAGTVNASVHVQASTHLLTHTLTPYPGQKDSVAEKGRALTSKS